MYALDPNHTLTVLYKHPRFGIGLEGFKSKIKIFEENYYYYHFTDKKVIEKKDGVAHLKITEDNLLQRLGLSMDLLTPRVRKGKKKEKLIHANTDTEMRRLLKRNSVCLKICRNRIYTSDKPS